MTRSGVISRTSRAAVVTVAALALATACSGGQTSPTGPATPSDTATTPGELTIQVPGTSLAVHDAVAHISTGRLTMSIRNGGTVPEHLAMVATPNGGRATLRGNSTGNGSLSTSGVLLNPGTTVTFGGQNGPAVQLPDVNGAVAGGTLPLTLQFGVAGLVHLRARVISH
jgi:copper(I)-binding protein